jgi:hypothetical protein
MDNKQTVAFLYGLMLWDMSQDIKSHTERISNFIMENSEIANDKDVIEMARRYREMLVAMTNLDLKCQNIVQSGDKQ